MEVTRDVPSADSFVPLATHLSRTPESFYSGPPVLYHHSPSATVIIQAKELLCAPVLQNLFNGSETHPNGTAATNGHNEEEDNREVERLGVDVWVTSERFILFHTSTSIGISIPYPSISLHAIQRSTPTSPPSLFLQLLIDSSTFDDHDPDATVSVIIVLSATRAAPPESAPAAAATNGVSDQIEQQDSAQALYTALSDCANLHPDPATPGSDDDDGGGQPVITFGGYNDAPYTSLDNRAPTGQQSALPPPMPGSGGWITAENVNQFFDEEGNWRGGASLGEGAGSVRRRNEEADSADGTGRGAEDGDPEAMDETKWRRTG